MIVNSYFYNIFKFNIKKYKKICYFFKIDMDKPANPKLCGGRLRLLTYKFYEGQSNLNCHLNLKTLCHKNKKIKNLS